MHNILTGVIKDKQIELEYLKASWQRTRTQLLVVMGIALLSVLLMMFAVFQDDRIQDVLPLLITGRILQFLGYAGVAYGTYKNLAPPTVQNLILIAQICTLIADGSNYSLSYLPALAPGNTGAMPFMVLILFLYYTVVPGKPSYHIGIGVLTTFSYMVMISLSDFASPVAVTYMFIQFAFVNLIGIGYCRFVNRLQRQDYLLKLQLEDEVKQRILAEEDALQASEEKSKFIAVAGHDLRQPLHSLGLWVDNLDDKIKHGSREDLGFISQKICLAKESLDDLLDRLLHISHLDASITEVERQSISLAELFLETKSRFKSAAEKREIHLCFVMSKLAVDSDRILLGRIIDNLVDNAIKYTPKGGRVTLGVRHRGANVAIQVWNTGPVIPETELTEIFREFHKISTGPQTRGLGLGLSIVKRLADLLAHSISVKSNAIGITVFELVLPKGQLDIEEKPLPALPRIRALDCDVLVIDDDEEVREATDTLLQSWGARVTSCATRSEVETILSQWRPDIILTDRQLTGGVNGVQLVQEMQKKFALNSAVIVTSGDTTTQAIQEFADSGYHILNKPVKPAILRMLLQRLK